MDVVLAVSDFDDVPQEYRDHEHTVEGVGEPDEKFVVVRAIAGAGELKSGDGVRIFTDTALDPDKATDIPSEGVEITASAYDASNLDHLDLD